MTKWTAWPVTVALVLALAACGSSGRSAPITAPTITALPLVGTGWGLVSYPDAKTGEVTQVPADVTVTAVFSDKSVDGTSGCNDYGGPYTTSGSAMTIGPVRGTLAFCEGDRGKVESAYLKALKTVKTYSIFGTALRLERSDKTPLLFKAVKSTPLTGTTWEATSLNNGKEGVETVDDQGAVTAEFGKTGKFAGDNGCNRVSGKYTTNGDLIKIGPLASTLAACADKAAQTQADRFDAALERATTFAITGDTLELRDGKGALQVAFVAKKAAAKK